MNAKEESEKLMNALLPFTKQMLQRYGEFYPHGGYIDADGKITLVGAQDPDTDHPKSKDLIYILRDSLRQACTRGCKGDAIQICIEHVDGYSVEVFFPYEIVDGQVVYGKTFAQAGKHEIFT